MGFRIRKSKTFKNGVRVTAGKTASVGFGGRRAGVSISKRGVRVRASIPGTGISYSSKVGGGRKRKRAKRSRATAPSGAFTWIVCLVVFVACCAVVPVLIPVFILAVAGIVVWIVVRVRRADVDAADDPGEAADQEPPGDGSVAVVCPGCSESFTVNYRADAVHDGVLPFSCPKCKIKSDVHVGR